MPTQIIDSPEVLGSAAAAEKQYKFFDPPHPEMPDQVLGLSTEAVMRLGKVAADIDFLPAEVRIGFYKLPEIVRLMPLLEQMQTTNIEAEDVRPYRRTIKNLSTKINDVDGLALVASSLGIGIPARRALNRRIEEEFSMRSMEQLEKTSSTLENKEEIAKYVEVLSSFEDPKKQFEDEVNLLADEVTTSIMSHHNRRINSPSQINQVEHGKGVVGLVRKAIGKVKSFFSRLFRKNKPAPPNNINAYDAADGIASVIDKVRSGGVELRNKMPMLSQLVFDKIPQNLHLPKDKLAFVAPEILNMIYSFSNNNRSQQIINSVGANPHELRFVTRFKRNFGRYSLDRLQNVSSNLMPAIRDVLPVTGSQINDIYCNLQQMIDPKNYRPITNDSRVKVSKISKAKGYLKNKFKRT